MTPKERTLAGCILALNLAVGLALVRRADLSQLLFPDVDGASEGELALGDGDGAPRERAGVVPWVPDLLDEVRAEERLRP